MGASGKSGGIWDSKECAVLLMDYQDNILPGELAAASDAVGAGGIAAPSLLPTVRPMPEVGVVSEKSTAGAAVPSVEGPRRAQTCFRRPAGKAPDRKSRVGTFDERSTGVKMEISEYIGFLR